MLGSLVDAGFLKYEPGGAKIDPSALLSGHGYRYVLVTGAYRDVPDSAFLLPLVRSPTKDRAATSWSLRPRRATTPRTSGPPRCGPTSRTTRSGDRISSVDDLEDFSGVRGGDAEPGRPGHRPAGHYGYGDGRTLLRPTRAERGRADRSRGGAGRAPGRRGIEEIERRAVATIARTRSRSPASTCCRAAPASCGWSPRPRPRHRDPGRRVPAGQPGLEHPLRAAGRRTALLGPGPDLRGRARRGRREEMRDLAGVLLGRALVVLLGGRSSSAIAAGPGIMRLLTAASDPVPPRRGGRARQRSCSGS